MKYPPPFFWVQIGEVIYVVYYLLDQRIDCTNDLVKYLRQSFNIDGENPIFRSNFGQILGKISEKVISGGRGGVRLFGTRESKTLEATYMNWILYFVYET